MSSGGKPRQNGLTIERRIYFTVSHSPRSLSAEDVRLRTGMPYWSVSGGLRRLTDGGYIKMLGVGRATVYLRIPGMRAPKDGRGMQPGSRENLILAPGINNGPRRIRGGAQPRPVAGTALEQAWGWLPTLPFSANGQENEDLLKYAGEVASAETVTPA